eukprot:m.938171 g.938171  ORF g.938171 m.938171 type:complete len:669 (-) comp23816_c0_seq4:379-2385(-)
MSQLQRERSNASFDVEKLMAIVAKDKPAMLHKFLPLFSGPPFDNQVMDEYLSYEDLFAKKIERVAAAFKIVRNNPNFLFAHMKQKVKMEDVFEHNGVFLHFTMMLNYIKNQGTEAQQKVWLERARNGDFIGAYAQSELGHGSNVRGIETIARFDPTTREYIIHSPTLTSLKWWPTGMYASTHAIVFAQLIIGDVNHGFHGFMVQLRRADGTLMPGIELGEIGPKLNSTSNNIGYCRFTHVHVPMDRLFSKYSRVTPNGEYVAAPKALSKFRYIAMMLARVSIIAAAYEKLAQAATIAIRYSAVRQQGFSADGSGQEHYVLDYTMQQYRTFKAVALAYCLLWNRRYITDFIQQVQKDLQTNGSADGLPELHATLSGMKATSTVWAHDAIEECRKCCGGQGFLKSSGIAKMAPDFSEWVTVEGEQVILSLQCARFLLKAVQDVLDGKTVAATAQYLGEKFSGPVDFESATGIMQLFRARSIKLVGRLHREYHKKVATGVSSDVAWNECAWLAYRASEAHVSYVMLQNNHLAIEKYFADASQAGVKLVMLHLLRLWTLQCMTENGGDFVGILTEHDMETLDAEVGRMLKLIRPDVVALVDSFGFLDAQLKSAIGGYDGMVYDKIYSEAKLNPLNNKSGGRMVGWDTLSEVLDLNFLEETAVGQHAGSSAKL